MAALHDFPHPSGLRGKKRPAVVIQADAYAARLGTPAVAEVTRNPALAGDPACLFIDAATPDGRATGVVRDCVVSRLVLVTEGADTLVQTLGRLSPALQAERDACVKAVMALP